MIDAALVRGLLQQQFAHWAGERVQPVLPGGWDNRSFRLGNERLLRFPSAAGYAPQVLIEYRWLPLLAPHLPVPIPQPLALGQPGPEYPWPWLVLRWIEGDTAEPQRIGEKTAFAADVARFLVALQGIDTTGGPAAGAQNFHRGAALPVHDAQMQQAFARLGAFSGAAQARALWQAALATRWPHRPVWVHGDVSRGNLLLQDGRLCAVIDFGQLAIGDPACDLVIAWTLLDGASRATFLQTLGLDAHTVTRGRAWALWKAMILAAGLAQTNAADWAEPWRVINTVLAHAD